MDIIRNLTKDTLKNPESSSNSRQWQQQHTSKNEEEMYEHLSEQELQKRVMKEKGWSNFREIFMISALNGEGTDDVKVIFFYCQFSVFIFSLIYEKVY